MKYKIVLPARMAKELKAHILSDRSREQMAVTLCGLNRLKDEIRLLGRHLILLAPDAFKKQSLAYLELAPEVQSQILHLAAQEGLTQIDWHSHPGESPHIGFSSIDDQNEERLARYLQEKIPDTYYASVVMNQNAFGARIWLAEDNRVKSRAIDSVKWGDLNEEKVDLDGLKKASQKDEMVDERFSRQVLAFGGGFQERLRQCRVGVLGVGGIGGMMVEMLARLGVSNWVLVDDDLVEASNLNRLPGSTQKDIFRKTSKVSLAQRNIAMANPYARKRALPLSVADPIAIEALKSCDFLIAATDNHSSRLIANRLSAQYLIPLIHVGVNIDVDEDKNITDMSGEYVLAPLGEWCLQCAGIIDSQVAGWELANEGLGATLRQRGYIKDTPAPAVYHLNGVIASLAVAEIHNFIFPYKTPRRYLTYDELKGELLSLEVQPKEDCLICHSEGGLLGLGDLEPFPDYERREKTIPSADQFGIKEDQKKIPVLSEEDPAPKYSGVALLPEEAGHAWDDA